MTLAPLWLGAGATIGAVGVLRSSWARDRRAAGLNLAGWALLAAGLATGAAGAGAWGVAVVSLCAMGAALAALGWAAWHSPPSRQRASNRRVGMLPQQGERRRIGRRIVTFLFVVLGAMVGTIALALAARWLGMVAGAGEANANVIALFATPLAWTGLAFALLMTDDRRRQTAMVVAATATALPAVLPGIAP